MAAFKSYLIGFSLFAIFLGGCATGRPPVQEAAEEHLSQRVVLLERRLQEKEEEIRDLHDMLRDAQRTTTQKTAALSAPAEAPKTARNIQIALRNAGFDPGAVDGKIGPKTRAAIRSFQRSKGLAADGVVGAKTWGELRRHLN